MPLTLAQQTTLNSLKSLRQTSNKPLTPISASDKPLEEVRRSTRKPCPSTRGRESQESKARYRASSRSRSPAGPKPNAKPKSGATPSKAVAKPQKHPFGVRGNRPGRIIQPAVNSGTTSHNSSPEPLAATDSELNDVRVETQRGGTFELIRISREKAIRLATKYLGQDASKLSKETLKKILEELPSLDEESSPGPLDAEGGNSSTQPKPTEQTVLGGGQQPPTNPAADDTNAQGANPQLGGALGPQPLEQPNDGEPAGGEPDEDEMDAEPAGDELATENSDTEPESECEVVELGPDDSVSQQIPSKLHALGPKKPTSHLKSTARAWTPPPHSTTPPRTPNPKKHPSDVDGKSDTAIIDSDGEVTVARKRQRLAQPPHLSQARQPSRPAPLGIFRPISSKAASLLLRAARHTPIRATASAPRTASSSASHGISKPPPASDIKSALAWAVEFVKQEARLRATTNQPVGNFDVLAQVLNEIHTLADPALPLQPQIRSPLSTSRSTDFISNHVAVLEAEAAIALGKRPRVRKQPALSDYPGLPGQIASLAIPELVATAISQGPYESYTVNDEWALDIFREVADCQTGGKDVEDPPRPLRGLMIRRISCFRGDALDRIRPLTGYRRRFISAPETIANLQHNIRIADSLLPNSFHCLDPANDTCPYEDPTLREYIALALFWGPDSLGVVFHKKFYPLPIPFIAFVLTLMQHAIGEWKTGRYVKAELDAKIQVGIYESHMIGLLAYEEEANGRFEEFREDAFWYGINHAGVSDELHEPYQPVTQADKIRPDSPATKARAKGKARA